jgi:manganese/iron transport system permease protein
MMGLGALIGVFVSLSGVYLSYYHNLPSGPAIVLVSSTLFLLVLLFSPSQGILIRSRLALHKTATPQRSRRQS